MSEQLIFNFTGLFMLLFRLGNNAIESVINWIINLGLPLTINQAKILAIIFWCIIFFIGIRISKLIVKIILAIVSIYFVISIFIGI